jgi:hypothetical protein
MADQTQPDLTTAAAEARCREQADCGENHEGGQER